MTQNQTDVQAAKNFLSGKQERQPVFYANAATGRDLTALFYAAKDNIPTQPQKSAKEMLESKYPTRIRREYFTDDYWDVLVSTADEFFKRCPKLRFVDKSTTIPVGHGGATVLFTITSGNDEDKTYGELRLWFKPYDNAPTGSITLLGECITPVFGEIMHAGRMIFFR